MKVELTPEELALIAESLNLSQSKWTTVLLREGRGQLGSAARDRYTKRITDCDQLINKIVDARTLLTIVRLRLDPWREDIAGRILDPDVWIPIP